MKRGAKVVVLSHFDRPKGKRVPAMSLRPIVPALAKAIGHNVAFADDCIGAAAEAVIEALKPGGVALLENLRYHAGEEANDPQFVRALAALGDIYVNDAFSAAHRAHASTEGLAHALPAYAGRQMQAELEALTAALEHPKKPVMAIVNVGEDQLDDIADVVAPVQAEFGDAAEVIGVCIQLEAEAAQLDGEERIEMLEGLGLGEGALPRFVRTAYHILGLRTFLTTGEKESRAWTFREGSTAPEAAGRIHTDFQRGFIRADTIQWDQLLAAGGWPGAKEAGTARVEGKDYIVQDGDVMEFRFNV